MNYKGFTSVDSANPYFELLYLPFYSDAKKPQFKMHLKTKKESDESSGFVLYDTNQCPFTAKYVPTLEEIAKKKRSHF